MRRFLVALALTILAGIADARAQAYPSRPITLVVPFPPGGSTDAAARIMAERMRAPLGQPIVIENVGGAGGSIGVGRVARAAPDGYTFDIGQWDTHVGSIIYKLDYDLEKDFEPIGLISNNPQLMVAKNDLPANNLAWTRKDVIARLNAATVEALADLAIQKRFTELGLDVAPREQQTPEGLAAFQKAEMEKWWPIIKSAGIGAQAQ